MKIHLIHGEIELYEEVVRSYQERSKPEFIKNLKPKLYFFIEEFLVFEETEDYYVRDSDGSYDKIFVHKVYNENKEYNYEDEVLNYPSFQNFSNRHIVASMPTLTANLEEAKEMLAKHMIERLKLEIIRSQKLIKSLSDKSLWTDESEHPY